MKRRVFYSFHYDRDNWRASQVRNIGVIEGNRPATDNNWEAVKRGGDNAIKRWIADEMHGRTCTLVLVGTHTANRHWIDYEIDKSWNDGMGVAGIYIHGLKNAEGLISDKGDNPFDSHTFSNSGKRLSTVVTCYDPPGKNSQERYSWIERNLSAIVEVAIDVRKKN